MALLVASETDTKVDITLGWDVIFPIDRNWLKPVFRPLSISGGERAIYNRHRAGERAFSFSGVGVLNLENVTIVKIFEGEESLLVKGELVGSHLVQLLVGFLYFNDSAAGTQLTVSDSVIHIKCDKLEDLRKWWTGQNGVN